MSWCQSWYKNSSFLTSRPCFPNGPVTRWLARQACTLLSLGFSSPPRFSAPFPPLLLGEHQPSTFRWLWIGPHPVSPRDSDTNPEEVALHALPHGQWEHPLSPLFQRWPSLPQLQALLLCLWFVLIREGGRILQVKAWLQTPQTLQKIWRIL